MHKYTRNSLTWLSLLLYVLLSAGCSQWKIPGESSLMRPEIFPDYQEVTIPCNMAPINFMVEEAEYVQASFSFQGTEMIRVKGRDGIIRIPLKKWKELLNISKGGNIDVQVSVWDIDSPQGKSYQSFPVHVASEEIDPWISYRLIEPGYVGWRQLGIYQRDITSFDESAIVTNRASNTTCINCHHYPSYSPESMMFHARGANGGTILYHEGELKKIDFKSIGPKKNTTYPAWHPEGRYIAFSSNTTHQVFFGEGEQPIEVFDTASDLVVYDTETGDVLTDPRFMTEDRLETFPAWSPDGKYLYFSSYHATQLPVQVSPGIRYDLYRVPFDAATGKFLWQKNDSETRYSTGTPVYHEGKWYFTAYQTLVEMDPRTGEQTRRVKQGHIFNTRSKMLIKDGVVVVGTSNHGMTGYRFDDFSQIWNTTTMPALIYTSPYTKSYEMSIEGDPVLYGDNIIYGANDGYVYCNTIEKGSYVWRFEMGLPVMANPVIDGEYLYVVDMGGKLVKLSLNDL